MSEIADFLNRQYDRIEKAAREATSGPWRVGDVVTELSIADVYGPDGRVTSAREQPCCLVEDAEHMVINDPAYVLADIASKREIVKRHSDPCGGDPSCSSIEYPENAEDCETLRLLAALFSAEPGYKQEWSV